MKKALLLFVFLFSIIVILKFFCSNYNLEYKVDGHSVETVYKNKRLYYEIDNKYNFDIYATRSFKKKIIKSLKLISDENINCLYPTIDGLNTYPLCIKDDKNIDYNLLDNEVLKKYKKEFFVEENKSNNFIYYNTLDENTYVALWNYKGYIIMNNDIYKNIELFNKDRYDNSMSSIINNTIYMPDYNEEHEFDRLITLDLITYKKGEIILDYKIDYDSYVVGNINNNLYIFDNKKSILYEINIKKEKTIIKGSNEIGYVKYENNSFVTCSKSEYKVDRIKYSLDESYYNYIFNKELYKTIDNNSKIKTIILDKEVTIVKEYQNKIYYILDDYLYEYNPLLGSRKVLYFFELNFNKDNTIFIYNN